MSRRRSSRRNRTIAVTLSHGLWAIVRLRQHEATACCATVRLRWYGFVRCGAIVRLRQCLKVGISASIIWSIIPSMYGTHTSMVPSRGAWCRACCRAFGACSRACFRACLRAWGTHASIVGSMYLCMGASTRACFCTIWRPFRSCTKAYVSFLTILMYIVHCTLMYIVHCTLYSTLYINVHCTLYIVHLNETFLGF